MRDLKYFISIIFASLVTVVAILAVNNLAITSEGLLLIITTNAVIVMFYILYLISASMRRDIVKRQTK